MGLKFREDPDLTFLNNCENDDLDILIQYLEFGTDEGKSERLTATLIHEERYKQHQPNHKAYWDLIGAELQNYGGNTLVNIMRGGEGVVYREILIDVCQKMKVNFNKKSQIDVIEMALLSKILIESLDKMDDEQLKEVIGSMGIQTTNLGKQAIVAAIQAAITLGKFQAYAIAVIVANALAKQLLGHGLRMATNAALTRSMAVFAGPIGWIITGLWTLVDIAGPAYRVTVPAVIQIAYMRTLNQATSE